MCRFPTLAQLSPCVSAPTWATDRPIARLAFALAHGWHRWRKPEMHFRWWRAHHRCGATDLQTPPVRFVFDLTVNNRGCLGFTRRGRCTSDLDSTCMNCFLRVVAIVWDLPQPHCAPSEQQIGSKLFPLPPAQSGGRNNMGACLAGAIKSRPRALFLHPIFFDRQLSLGRSSGRLNCPPM
jgi:hypothetical protein